jgi:hypothetical protein
VQCYNIAITRSGRYHGELLIQRAARDDILTPNSLGMRNTVNFIVIFIFCQKLLERNLPKKLATTQNSVKSTKLVFFQ